MAFKGDVEDDANIPDRAEDIKPRFHFSKAHGFEGHYDESGGDGNVGELIDLGEIIIIYFVTTNILNQRKF